MDNIKSGINSFYIGEDPENAEAEITFVLGGDNIITIDHTFVSENLRGQSIALKLVNKVAEYARTERKKIIPQCSYAKKVMTGRKEYEDVLYKA
ncbi:MAG: GNAT family N-acetyltransferase [Eubacteriales bacterium]